jgi:hypothetical protein
MAGVRISGIKTEVLKHDKTHCSYENLKTILKAPQFKRFKTHSANSLGWRQELKEKNFNFQKLCKILEEIQHFQIKLEKCVAKFAILYRG